MASLPRSEATSMGKTGFIWIVLGPTDSSKSRGWFTSEKPCRSKKELTASLRYAMARSALRLDVMLLARCRTTSQGSGRIWESDGAPWAQVYDGVRPQKGNVPYPLVIWHNYGKSPFIVSFPMKNGDFFIEGSSASPKQPKWPELASGAQVAQSDPDSVSGHPNPPWPNMTKSEECGKPNSKLSKPSPNGGLLIGLPKLIRIYIRMISPWTPSSRVLRHPSIGRWFFKPSASVFRVDSEPSAVSQALPQRQHAQIAQIPSSATKNSWHQLGQK